MRKHDQTRPYPPDFLDVATLAYRLCCSERVVQDYVKAGILPKPVRIGNLVRWPWDIVVSHIEGQNSMNDDANCEDDDACAAAIEKARKAREKASGRAS